MKAPNLIASIAAVLITATTLGIIFHHVDRLHVPVAYINGIHVTDLAPVNVQASAAEQRAALLTDTGGIGNGSSLMLGHDEGIGGTASLRLLGSQLAMPYYSFGNKFGHLSSKE